MYDTQSDGERQGRVLKKVSPRPTNFLLSALTYDFRPLSISPLLFLSTRAPLPSLGGENFRLGRQRRKRPISPDGLRQLGRGWFNSCVLTSVPPKQRQQQISAPSSRLIISQFRRHGTSLDFCFFHGLEGRGRLGRSRCDERGRQRPS